MLQLWDRIQQDLVQSISELHRLLHDPMKGVEYGLAKEDGRGIRDEKEVPGSLERHGDFPIWVEGVVLFLGSNQPVIHFLNPTQSIKNID